MWKIARVARREFLDTVKTRTFLLSLLLIPVLVVGIIFLSKKMVQSEGGPRPSIRVGVTSLADDLSARIKVAFDEHNKSHPQSPLTLNSLPTGSEEQGKDKLRRGALDAYVVLEGDLEGKEGTVQFYTYKPKASQIDAIWSVERLFRDAVVSRRCEARGIDRAMLAEIQSVAIRRVELGDEQGREKVQSDGQRVARMMVPFAFMYLIFIGIVGMGQHMISSIIEEKNSRIIEMLLSAISPFELMAGKILGLAGVGLTVMVLWGLAAYGAAVWRGINVDVGLDLVAYGLVYYVLGFILFSAILAGVGSVCNTIKETQSLMMPITLIFVVPLIAWPQLARDPNGDLARVLSYVPPTTPMLMVLRLASSPDIWPGEIALSILVLVVGVFVTIWAAARIFRTGILLYGKRPSPREVLRWLREK
ncbi:MAG TPA: ABC transporter permease [Sedimentisphaerales bacterium]|jgi:ABC-2 type transport system permease protein|nr:ABC transporter permease [Sedimentisphaerales bacterium]HNU28222.1 ABC transporter permease [Sedimentisphaerales bacterium]